MMFVKKNRRRNRRVEEIDGYGGPGVECSTSYLLGMSVPSHFREDVGRMEGCHSSDWLKPCSIWPRLGEDIRNAAVEVKEQRCRGSRQELDKQPQTECCVLFCLTCGAHGIQLCRV